MSPANPPSLTSLVGKNRILLTVGAGGVGKTTTAAAIGVLAAKSARKSLVMTIDPAHRLAVSLGLRALDHEERVVPRQKMEEANLPHGFLHAMMLDRQRAFDDLIRRQAPDEASVQRVMANKLYRVLSTRLAGGEEYAAMEMLYALSNADRYDLLVLDTPPTANALDFLDAPQKMVNLMDSAVVRYFVKSYQESGRFSLRVLSLGAAFVFRRLSKFVGGGFLDDVAAFFGDFNHLLQGFRDRAAAVVKLLADKNTGFVIVTSPDPRAIDEAIGLHDRLVRSRMVPAAFVINRVHETDTLDLSTEEIAQLAVADGLAEDAAKRISPLLLASQEKLAVLARADRIQITRLTKHCGDTYPYVEIPFFDQDIHDVDGLIQISDYLGATVSAA
jgi:anion-transporting  ArsA/GET3 family ATPase